MDSNKQIWRITLLYFAFGFAWIYLTDKIVLAIAPGFEPILQTYKGWIYVTGTTLMLFGLLKASQKKLVISRNKIEIKDKLLAQKEQEKKALAKLTAELKEANEELQTFNYSVSHDIKSPLRVIQGYSEVLHRKYHHTIDKEDSDMIDHIRSSVKHINELISNLLVFASVGKSNMKMAELDMDKLVVRVVQECRNLYHTKQFSVSIANMPIAKADGMLMYHVVSNLVSNAFKYSSKTTEPKIEIGGSVIDGKAVYYVKDNGAGFDMAHMDEMFKPFKRLHSATEFEGSGVGLAIANRIIAKHEGKIWGESVAGTGSTFYFSLPLMPN